MFDHNWDNFQDWAGIDQNYVNSEASTGIYQCYCIYKNNHNKPKKRPNGEPKKLHHHKEWTLARIIGGGWYNTCDAYFWAFLGGSKISMTVGIAIGILNNLTSALVFKLISSVNFHSSSTQSSGIIITIFLMTYFNSGLFVTWLP